MKTAERYTKHLEQMCGPLNERTKYAAVMLFREALNEPAAELEAQHRKTWAMAEKALQYYYEQGLKEPCDHLVAQDALAAITKLKEAL